MTTHKHEDGQECKGCAEGFDKMLQALASNIVQYGRAVVAVGGSEVETPEGKKIDEKAFTYSVGNTIHEVPELIIANVAPKMAAMLINHMSKTMISDGLYPLNTDVSIGGTHPLRLMELDDRAILKYCPMIANLLGDDSGARVWEIIVPDVHGRFPEHPDCDPTYKEQPRYATPQTIPVAAAS